MKILNNEEFALYFVELSKKKVSEIEESGLDAGDYQWFLTDVLSSIDNKHVVRITKDSDGSNTEYIVISGEIEDNQTNKLTLQLENIKDKTVVEESYIITKVVDTRIPKHVKYYIDTDNERYTFFMYK